MPKSLSAHELLPPSSLLTLTTVERTEAGWTVIAHGPDHARCPRCRQVSTARHSRYVRTPGVSIGSSISPLLHQCSEGVFDGAQPTPQLGGFLLLFCCPAILLIARETDAVSESASGDAVKVGALTPGTEGLRRFHAAPDDVGLGS
jgi:hypothetical protein